MVWGESKVDNWFRVWGRHEGLRAELLDSWVERGGCMGLKDTVTSPPPFHCRSPKEVGDVIALSDITPSGAADHSQEPSPVGLRRGHITPNLSRASSDADHGVSRRVRERGGC